MSRLLPSSHARRTVLTVLGPLAMLVTLVFAIPFIGALFDRADSAADRVVFSSLLDEARRRDALPVLRQLRTFGGPEAFRNQQFLRFADVVGDRLLVVGGTTVTPFDLQSGEAGPALDLDGIIGAIGTVRSVTLTRRSELWIDGNRGFVRFDPATPNRPAQVVALDGEATRPVVWFGDSVVAAGRRTLLRFYAADDTATLMREAGDPLFPIVDAGLIPFFNLVSFTVHPDQQQLAVAFQLSARLHLYDRAGALTRAVAGPVEIKLDFDIVPRAPDVGGHTFGLNGETRMAYRDVDSDASLIAALFAGRSRNTGANNLFAGDELHVFRWDGTLVGTWRLPEAVTSFRLDEARRRIYAVRQDPTWAILELDASPLYMDEAKREP